MQILRGLLANGCSSIRCSNTWRKVKVSKWKSPSWSIAYLDQKMRTSASSCSLKQRGMNVLVKKSYLLDTAGGGRGAKVADAVQYIHEADHM